MAYRKAKVDLFYSSVPRRVELLDYEEHLEEQLHALLTVLNGVDESWIEHPTFLGGFTFDTKGVEGPPDDMRSFWSSPSESWRRLSALAPPDKRPVASFRLMARCSIALHVFSTLWMLEVGTYLDSRLSDSAYGNRLRHGPGGEPDLLSRGTFRSYESAYRRWRDDGLRAMRDSLAQGKSVVALTADVTAFYHHLDPSFLLDDRFLRDVLEVQLTPAQQKLNRLFVAALKSWASLVAARTGTNHRGLPVGLPASAVVANLALTQLDTVAETLSPRFYGRYVDDITLVIEDGGEFGDQATLWRWLVERSGGLLTRRRLETANRWGLSDNAIHFVPPYLSTSVVAFENRKNKTFHLRGRSGSAMIDAIEATIRERVSEWRSLSSVPASPDEIGATVASVLQADGDEAATLRDADRVSARKHSFSLKLRDLELFERNLPSREWRTSRQEFVRAACEHVLALPAFFELSGYLPRLIALCASCHDGESLATIFEALNRLVDEVSETCAVQVAGFPADDAILRRDQHGLVLHYWVQGLVDQALEGVTVGWRALMKPNRHIHMAESLAGLMRRVERQLPEANRIFDTHARLAARDLAYRPYRWRLLRLPQSYPVPSAAMPPVPVLSAVAEGANELFAMLRERHGRLREFSVPGQSNAGVMFATRPPSLNEIYQAAPSLQGGRYGVQFSERIQRVLLGLRGYTQPELPDVKFTPGWPALIDVPVSRRFGPVRIALGMIQTHDADVENAARGYPRLTPDRLRSLQGLMDAVRKQQPRPEYLMLPEVSVPAALFVDLAKRMRRSGISLIAGIEHQTVGPNQVTNQVQAALRLDGLGRPFVIYAQDKQRPAKVEVGIFAKHGLSLEPIVKWDVPPVVAHGDFHFAFLICSEMTNIRSRAHLRGAVDALLVPEWNQDLHWFESLVESAALDLHTYVAQANTLGLGDTRLRGPFKEGFARDVVRLKGGTHDYFVTGEIDHRYLRAVQWALVRGQDMPQAPTIEAALKPVPDGFDVDPRRPEFPTF